MEQGRQDLGHQRSRQSKGCCGSCEERKERQKVDELSGNTVYPVSEQCAAGFRVFLLMTASYMKHKAEGDSEYQIERPRDRTPVEQRVGAGPGLHGTHLGDMRIVRVKDPLTERVEQDIGRKSGGEHHARPDEEGIFWLFIRLSEADRTESGECQIQGEQEDKETDGEIEQAEGIAKDKADRVENAL